VACNCLFKTGYYPILAAFSRWGAPNLVSSAFC